MPIYEYRCMACGLQKEFLQKMSDAPLKDCPECGKSTLSKMVTAAGFQLKGSGWYVTDFKNGSKPADTKSGGKTAKADDKSVSTESAGAKTENTPASESAAPKTEAAKPAPTSATGTGTV